MTDDNDIVRLEVHSSQPGSSDIMNVYHFIANTTGGPIEDGEITDALSAWLADLIYDPIEPYLSVEWVSEYARVYNVTQEVEIGLIDGSDFAVGENTENALPAGVAALVTLSTNVPRRIGRKFFAGMGIDTVTLGTWVTGLTTALAVMSAAFMLPIDIDVDKGLRYIVWNELTDVGSFANGLLVRDLPAYQRRRKANVGS